MITHNIESYCIQVKRRQSQSYKLKKFAKIANFWISKLPLHATHLLKLLAKMCQYEIDPMSIVENTERTQFCPQTDRRTDGQGDTSIPPFQLRWSGGYNHCQIKLKLYKVYLMTLWIMIKSRKLGFWLCIYNHIVLMRWNFLWLNIFCRKVFLQHLAQNNHYMSYNLRVSDCSNFIFCYCLRMTFATHPFSSWHNPCEFFIKWGHWRRVWTNRLG